MASRRFDPLRILGLGRVVVSGTFFPQNTGAVNNAMNKGKGFSVARNSAGIYTITFDDKYAELVSRTNGIQDVLNGDWSVLFGAYSPAAQTLVIVTRHLGSLEDLPVSPNNSVSFNCTFRNTSVDF